jgi:hypothetical protein
MKLYLRVYKLERMISPYVDMLQRTVCQWNHCSLRVDETIIHFFDTDLVPRWTSTKADARLYKIYKDIYIGDLNNLEELRSFTNSLPRFSYYDDLSRHLWYYSLGLWPKRRDCVDKCSATLTYLCNIPRCYSTPDKLIEMINDYRNQRFR